MKELKLCIVTKKPSPAQVIQWRLSLLLQNQLFRRTTYGKNFIGQQDETQARLSCCHRYRNGTFIKHGKA